ncbi:MAG: hypothetical protein EA386_01270 [Rhodobacteraceae bacterium]|nr:MAG: hypothetical protein EA386_01270 [Paracoccaceae bacterium]
MWKQSSGFFSFLAALKVALAAIVLGISGMTGSGGGVQAATEPSVIERAVSLTPRRPLLAHIRFCLVYEGQCDIRSDRRDPSMSVQDHRNEAMRVNFRVNRAIRPKPDEGFDSWDINVTEGDCEDYALQKRADLIALGWPTDHLRIAIVRTAQKEPHAVLLVRIGGVDYVLDNLTPDVLRWDRTGHHYLMLQDRDDPRAWHDIAPHGAGTS